MRKSRPAAGSAAAQAAAATIPASAPRSTVEAYPPPVDTLGLDAQRRLTLAAAQAESLLLWPGMAVLDRVHPDRRSGRWPPLLTDGRVFAYEAAVHALFGAVLGALARAD